MRDYVYLAGPMSGRTWDEMNKWRDKAKTDFFLHGVVTRSPTRAKPFLQDPALVHQRWYSTTAVSRRDRNDVKNAAAVLMNLEDMPLDRVSIGTMVELGWADAFGVPVIVVWNGEAAVNETPHVFLRALSTELVYTLDDGIRAVLELLDIEPCWLLDK